MLSFRLFVVVLLSIVTLNLSSAWAHDKGHDKSKAKPPQTQESLEFTQTRTQAITKLRERGYQVHSIQLQMHLGEPVFVIHTSKNGVRYLVKLTYPNLKIIQERRL